MSDVLRLEGVTKVYNQGQPGEVQVLRGVDLAIGRGEVVALVAPSGAGKSTLLHIAGLLDAADGGRVELDGAEMTRLSGAERTRARREDRARDRGREVQRPGPRRRRLRGGAEGSADSANVGAGAPSFKSGVAERGAGEAA